MKIFLSELVNKLKNFSQDLDNHAILVNQPWVANFENPETRCKYIFRDKDSQLVVSKNGNVVYGKWEYLPSIKSLLIDFDNETTLYNQGFFDNSIMILKKDSTSDYQLFVNETKIESTIEELLKRTVSRYKHKNIQVNTEKTVQFITGLGEVKIFTTKEQGYAVGDRVLLNNIPPENGKIKIGLWRFLQVENGKITKIK